MATRTWMTIGPGDEEEFCSRQVESLCCVTVGNKDNIVNGEKSDNKNKDNIVKAQMYHFLLPTHIVTGFLHNHHFSLRKIHFLHYNHSVVTNFYISNFFLLQLAFMLDTRCNNVENAAPDGLRHSLGCQ